MDRIAKANLSVYVDDNAVAHYLAVPYHARRVALATELLLRRTRGRTERPLIADLGAGSPAASVLLRGHGARVVMVDMRHLGAVPSGCPAVLPVRADLSGPLPFRGEVFDGVYAGEIVEHLFDPVEFLHECRRIMVPGGVIVVTTPNLASLQDRARFLLGRSPRQVDPHHPYLKLHIRPFTYSSLARALERCGFTSVDLRSNYVVVGGARRAISSRFLARVFPSVGGSLILAGVKNGRDRAVQGGGGR
jgi:SAM-dependent methyltransferase